MSDDIMNGMKLKELECIVAINDCGTGWIVAQSDHLRERDVLLEEHAEDNGFRCGWDKGLGVGVYLLTIKPWSRQSYDGEYYGGIDVLSVTPLWQATSDFAETA